LVTLPASWLEAKDVQVSIPCLSPECVVQTVIWEREENFV